jgi:ElaB/YqjD/DUF883 family membrane-anchored ribosome-binding protein
MEKFTVDELGAIARQYKRDEISTGKFCELLNEPYATLRAQLEEKERELRIAKTTFYKELNEVLENHGKVVSQLTEQSKQLAEARSLLDQLMHQYKEEIRSQFPKDDPRSQYGKELNEWVSDLPTYHAAKQFFNQ